MNLSLIRITGGAEPNAGIEIGELFIARSYPLDLQEKWTLLEKVSSSVSHYEPQSMNHYKIDAEVVQVIGNLVVPTKTLGGYEVTKFEILKPEQTRGVLPPYFYKGIVNDKGTGIEKFEIFWTADGEVNNQKRSDCNVKIEHAGLW